MNGLIYLKDKDGKIYNSRSKLFGLTETDYDNLELVVSEKFDNANWSKEPEESLSELYKRRAYQIRDMYNYIIFYFSGGSDSITALNTFVKNNIPIDEIVVYINSDTDNPKLSGKYALDYLKYINYSGYVNIIDQNYNMLSKIIYEESWRKYESFSGLLHSFHRFQVSFFEENNYVISKERTGNIGHVFSTTTPSVSKIQDDYVSRLNANAHICIAAAYYKNVLFYTDENMPEVFIKQSYIIARYMKENNLILSNEDKEFKILIRDEYNEEISPVKNAGSYTYQLKSIKDILSSQHVLLMLLYKDKKEFLKYYFDSTKQFAKFKMTKSYARNYELNLD